MSPAARPVPYSEIKNAIDRSLRDVEASVHENVGAADETFAGRTMIAADSQAGAAPSPDDAPVASAQSVALPRAFRPNRQPLQSSPLARHRVVTASHTESPAPLPATQGYSSDDAEMTYAEGTSRMHPDYTAIYAEGVDVERMVEGSFVTSAPTPQISPQRAPETPADAKDAAADEQRDGAPEEMEGVESFSAVDDISDFHASRASGSDADYSNDSNDELSRRSLRRSRGGGYGSDGLYYDPEENSSASPEVNDSSAVLEPDSQSDESGSEYFDRDLPQPDNWSMSTPRPDRSGLSAIQEESIYSPVVSSGTGTPVAVGLGITPMPLSPSFPSLNAGTGASGSTAQLPQLTASTGASATSSQATARPLILSLYPPPRPTIPASTPIPSVQLRSPSVEFVAHESPSCGPGPDDTILTVSSTDTDRVSPEKPARTGAEERENVAELRATGELSPDCLRALQEGTAVLQTIAAGAWSVPAPTQDAARAAAASDMQPRLALPTDESAPREPSSGKTPKAKRSGKSRSSSREPSADPDGYRPTRRSGRSTKPVKYNE